jgi:hypothetical protein
VPDTFYLVAGFILILGTAIWFFGGFVSWLHAAYRERNIWLVLLVILGFLILVSGKLLKWFR